MKALFIGGTGTISTAIVKRLAENPLWEVWLLNRGNRTDVIPDGVHQIICDISDEEAAAKALEGMEFDVVSEFIGFTLDQVERDYRLFKGKTKQYMYISSASAYNKPAANYVITEEPVLLILIGSIQEIR
jgi:nucleoside-diphosphate-sugar epimerase